ncbi:MAG: immunoglobulin domain-containing protein [Gemmataceae bacterium]|nr:immunoglobulin domain-containing protein [Gemmataceae bacterium]
MLKLTTPKIRHLLLTAGSVLATALGSPALAGSVCNIGDDFCVIHPAFTVWYVDADSSTFGWENHGGQLGWDSDRPNFLAGEPRAAWANGRDDFFICRPNPANATELDWYGRANLGTTEAGNIELVGAFGLGGDHALIGDFQNSGDQIAVVGRRNGDLWFIVDSNRNMDYDELADRKEIWNIPFGPNDRVLAGYFLDSNGEDLAVYRDGTNRWELYRQEPIWGVPDSPECMFHFGSAGELPMTADFNGDGRADIAMWNAQWNRLFINLWEPGAPSGGYGPDHDVDEVRDYSAEVTWVNNHYGTPGLQWNTAALGLNFDSSQRYVPPIPYYATWNDPRILCADGGGTVTLSAWGTDQHKFVWTTGECGGTKVGEGQTVVLPAPTKTTTYYVHTETWGSCPRQSECNSVTLVVGDKPSITSHPSSTSTCPGGTACFSVAATSTSSNTTYLWRRNGVPLSDGPTGSGSTVQGASTPNLCIVGATAADEHDRYECVVSNSCGQAVSATAALDVVSPAKILESPYSQGACFGNTVYLSVNASGEGSVSYSWRKGGQALSDGPTPHGSVISGSSTSVLTITNVRPEDMGMAPEGVYDCHVYNGCGSELSGGATLGECRADLDCSGFVDTDDFTSFVLSFELGDLASDFDRSGFVDTDDFTAFVLAFEAGC